MSDSERPTGLWNAASLLSGTEPAQPADPPPVDVPPTPPGFAGPPPAPIPPPPSGTPLADVPPLLPPPPPVSPVPSRPGAGRRPLLVVVAAAAAAAVAAGVVAVVLMNRSGGPDAEAASFAAPATTVATPLSTDRTTDEAQGEAAPPTESTPESQETSLGGDTTSPDGGETLPGGTTEDDAVAELQRLSDDGLAQVSFQGQYAAQIASKYPGIADPLQTTATGSHTFGAADILDEHRRLSDAHGSAEHPVILLKSTDYGKRQMVGTEFLWVTFAIGDFPDRQSVLDWCGNQFAELTAKERENQCAVRRLEPGR
ncbi:hypothetical protein ACIA5D_06565 [Actinoplanes sp. NPDC051513]|uniref:hypothetical protein n=1 Tax=Actinoplanes sp. NPDC051513 TaxID=3363908 RepID=UPI0037B6C56F